MIRLSRWNRGSYDKTDMYVYDIYFYVFYFFFTHSSRRAHEDTPGHGSCWAASLWRFYFPNAQERFLNRITRGNCHGHAAVFSCLCLTDKSSSSGRVGVGPGFCIVILLRTVLAWHTVIYCRAAAAGHKKTRVRFFIARALALVYTRIL